MKVFLSYSHRNKAEADAIDSFLQGKGYTIIRDIRVIRHKDDIKEYCGTIRDCDAAILLISDAYFKSRWCMFELVKIIYKIPENLIKEIEQHLNDETNPLLKQLYASGRSLSES